MTSTSSSSNDLITDCAPVTCSGATCLGCCGGVAGVLAWAPVPLTGCDGADGSGGRVVGALTVSSSGPLRRCLNGDNKKPPPAQRLHEGCALVLESVISQAPTRRPSTTSISRLFITLDGSLRTGQQSNLASQVSHRRDCASGRDFRFSRCPQRN